MTERILQQHGGVSYSPGEIAALRDLFLSLSKGIRASRQYPSQHRIPSQFKTLFFEKLKSFFETCDLVAIKVAHDSLQVENEVVFKGSMGPDNIAQLLHRDGIRYLEITPEVTVLEVSAFFESLVTCSSRDDGAEDIVNLFWQAGFDHINYDVVDVFEIAEIQELRQEFDSTRSSVVEEAAAPPDIDDSLPTISPPLFDQFTNIADFSPEELRLVREMVEKDRAVDSKSCVVELMLELCESPPSPQDLSLAVEALQSTFDKMIQEASFPTMTGIVRKVRQLLETGHIESPVAERRFTEFVSRCGDSLRIKMIAETLNRHEDIDLEPVRHYLEELGWESLNALLWMLGELVSYPARKMVCNLLAEKGLDRIDILGSAVFDSRWYLVRNVIWVLGETGDNRALSFLRRAASHPDLRVRTEVVKALAKVRGATSDEILLAMLQDESEKIRGSAAAELGHSKTETAFSGLRQIVMSKDFVNVPPAEIRQIVDAMVASGGVPAIEVVRNLLKRSPLFGRALLHRLQDVAIQSLRQSTANEAQALLKKLADDPKSRHNLTAKRVMAQMQFTRKGKGDGESE
jgi:hypothetical protein